MTRNERIRQIIEEEVTRRIKDTQDWYLNLVKIRSENNAEIKELKKEIRRLKWIEYQYKQQSSLLKTISIDWLIQVHEDWEQHEHWWYHVWWYIYKDKFHEIWSETF